MYGMHTCVRGVHFVVYLFLGFVPYCCNDGTRLCSHRRDYVIFYGFCGLQKVSCVYGGCIGIVHL